MIELVKSQAQSYNFINKIFMDHLVDNNSEKSENLIHEISTYSSLESTVLIQQLVLVPTTLLSSGRRIAHNTLPDSLCFISEVKILSSQNISSRNSLAER